MIRHNCQIYKKNGIDYFVFKIEIESQIYQKKKKNVWTP